MKSILLAGLVSLGLLTAPSVKGLNFTIQSTVNTSTHQSVLYLQGTANRAITIEQFGGGLSWIPVATVVLSAAGTGAATLPVDNVTALGHHRFEFSWIRYSLFRAKERDNGTVRSSNAYSALYGGLSSMQSFHDEIQLGNKFTPKSLTQLIQNPVNGLQVIIENGSEFTAYTYDDLAGTFSPSNPTINSFQGFWIRGLNTQLTTIVQLSGLYDESPITKLLVGNGHANLIASENMVAMASMGNLPAGLWLDFYDDSLPSAGTTSSLPKVPGAQVHMLSRTVSGGSAGTYLVNQYDDIDNAWISLSLIETTGVDLLRGVFYKLPTGSASMNWRFSQKIW